MKRYKTTCHLFLIFRRIKDEGYGEGDVIELLQCSSQLPSLERIADSRKKEINDLDQKEQKISFKVFKLMERLNKLEKLSEEKQSEFDELVRKIKIKQALLKITQDRIEGLKSSEDYPESNEIIEKKVT